MARGKPKAPENTLAGWSAIIMEQGGRAKTESSGAVREIPVRDPRELITIEPDHALWKKPRANVHGLVAKAIVRLRPPTAAQDADVDRIRKWFFDHGAEIVTVLPRPRAETVPASVAARRDGRAVTARQAVIELANESNSKDKDALLKLLERVMGKAGL